MFKFKSQITPCISLVLLISWIWSVECQYYGEPPYFDPLDLDYPPYLPPDYYPPQPQLPQPQPQAPPSVFNNLNPFLPTGQNQQQRPQQQLQGSYPNLPSFPFQTVTPGGQTQNPGISSNQRVDRYPFNGNSFGGNPTPTPSNPSFSNSLLQNNQLYPNFPNLPFQTISPGQSQGQIDPAILALFQNSYLKPKIELPKIRVIEFPSSEYFEYGGGKLVQPKRPNADLYVGGSGGDVPLTSKVFIECTGPNQVEWLFSGNNVTTKKKDLSVVTKNFQITIPEERGPTPGSREYTYLRLGLEEQITEKDSGVYTCRDRVLPQNYITIRVIVAKPVTGRPNYPFRPGPSDPKNPNPKDPNTIYYTDNDSTVTLPCKIENADATISLHKHEMGKLSCPYTMDGRVIYDRFRGFIIQTRAFKDLEGRYVCVGDFGGELKLMKYRIVRTNDFTSRFVEGLQQNIIALGSNTASTSQKTDASSSGSSSSFLDKVDTSFPNSILSGLTTSELNTLNLTAAGLVDPRSEFELETEEQSSSSGFTLPSQNQNQNQNQKKSESSSTLVSSTTSTFSKKNPK